MRALTFDTRCRRRHRTRGQFDSTACVFFIVYGQHDLTLLRLCCRTTHSDFERASVDSRELCALDEQVLGCSVADVVKDELCLRRRFKVRETQRSGALLQIRDEMEHDRWARRAEPVVGSAHRESVVEALDTRLQRAQYSSYR